MEALRYSACGKVQRDIKWSISDYMSPYIAYILDVLEVRIGPENYQAII